ncbi:MAG: RtcB family protein [Caldilineaceae bacterium]
MIFASRRILDKALTDRSIEQLVNATTLPGIVGYAIAMPDVHQGYGFPVGGGRIWLPDGVISPGAIGYDINCGVRLLAANLTPRRSSRGWAIWPQRSTPTVPVAWAKTGAFAQPPRPGPGDDPRRRLVPATGPGHRARSPAQRGVGL